MNRSSQSFGPSPVTIQFSVRVHQCIVSMNVKLDGADSFVLLSALPRSTLNMHTRVHPRNAHVTRRRDVETH